MSAVVASSAFRPVAARALVGGTWRSPERTVEVRDPYRGDVVGSAPVSSTAELGAALDAAVDAREKVAAMPAYERAALLRKAAGLIERDVKSLA